VKRHLALAAIPLIALGCDVDRAHLATSTLSYELASSGSTVTDVTQISAPAVTEGPATYWSQDSVRETAALVNFIEGLKQATDAYFAKLIQTCDTKVAQENVTCDPQQAQSLDLTCEEYVKQQLEYLRRVCLGNEDIAPDVAAGVAKMKVVVAFLEQEQAALGRKVLEQEIALAKEIQANMSREGAAPPYRDWGMGSPSPGYAGAPMADASSAGGGSNLGATPGGAQDIGYLRTVVEEGYVPLPFHLATEGLFSEHNLPIESSVPCDQLLCVRAATGLAPVIGTGVMNYFVQIGFSSNLKADTFKRSPLNLVVVLDKSGSMSGPASETLTKMEAVKMALTEMVDRLDANDRLAIIAFNSSHQVLLASAAVTNRPAIKKVIASIEDGGGTNIEGALKAGFEIAAQNSVPRQRLDRVMLLTDALPNVGSTGDDSFLGLTESYAKREIGLTTFGVGINFGQELVVAISRIRGGNYFFLEDADRIKEVFDLDFDYLVTPLAYDMHLELVPGSWVKTVGVHGIPNWEEGQNKVQMDVETLFLSRNHGAIMIQLEPTGTPSVVQ
jgi:Ca-activated chloride channel family protein